MSARLQDKVAIVTGGSSGIGRGIVARFAQEGAQVVTCSRRQPEGDLPDGVHWVQADVAQAAEVDALRDATLSRFGHIDILVNNAGIQIEKSVTETSDEEWARLIGVNVQGVFLCCRAVIPNMAESGGGAIVNIGSTSGFVADPGLAVYNASKGFVHGLTRSLAVDHGPDGIRCNAVCPGWILTELADAAFAIAKDPAAAERDALARHPVGRMGTPADIANAVLWLASDEAAYVTGQLYLVDGGLTAVSPINPALF
ncbi:MAG: SDR family oxidoreductase [Pseudomonadota bacterium]